MKKIKDILNDFRLCRRLTAGGVGVAAFVVYLLTLEPTASFWDCPEYITQAALMEVGHPPGNPTWLLFARMAAMLAPSASQIAFCVNLTSALFTALAAMLLTLTVIGLALRLRPDSRVAALLGGAVGGLAFAFCDTAWFSAVEAEVYAFSIFGTALCFWLAMKWGDAEDPGRRARLLILLAYITGLSIGVHQLNLLCIPALALMMVYMRRPGRIGWRRAAGVLALSVAVIAFILFGLMPGMVWLAGRCELLAVNSWGLRYNSGVLLFLILWFGVMAALVIALREGYLRLWSYRARYRAYLSVWSVAMVSLGFCTFGIVMLRAAADPPMNEGDPRDIFSFARYLNREQYGSRPLLRGRTPQSRALRAEVMTEDSAGGRHASYPDIARRDRGARYARVETGARELHRSRLVSAADSAFNRRAAEAAGRGSDAYVVTDHAYELCYPPELDMWLPRIVSGKDSHLDAYEAWIGMTDSTMVPEKVSYAVDAEGKAVGRFDEATGDRVKSDAKRPSYLQNLEILFSYQIGYMYFRYLMWNFCGRQNDVPSQGQVDAGNFITGFPLIDRAMLGDNSLMPRRGGAGDDSRNAYYMLPLLLGVAGIVRLLLGGRKGRREFYVIGLLFFMTGLAIVLYLNQTPGEPRERDYSFVGSFYAFAMWIGLGAAGIVTRVRGRVWKTVAGVCCLAVPVQMLAVNYADHDRSGRTAARDYAVATLTPLDRDALIFVNGDNYTFPLWYAQETEGVRGDVRIVNIAYLSTAWYARQLAIPTEEGGRVPMTMPAHLPAYGAFQTVLVPADGSVADAREALARLYTAKSGGTPRLCAQYLRIPTAGGDSIILNVRSAAGTHYLTLGKLLTLDIIATNAYSDRPRPVYWSAALPDSHKMGLGRYGGFCGLAVRVTDTVADLKCSDPERVARDILGMPMGFSRAQWPDEPSLQYIRLIRRAARIAANGLLDKEYPTHADSLAAARLAKDVVFRTLQKLNTTRAPFTIFTDRYLSINEAVETALLFERLDGRIPGKNYHDAALGLLAREMKRQIQWRKYYDALPPRLRAVVSPEVRTRIRGFYAPFGEYLRLVPADSLKVAEMVAEEGYDLAEAEQSYRRTRVLQRLLRESRFPTADGDTAALRREYLRLGGEQATLLTYKELNP